ncbi:retrovirus-related pol polyprotein from transposon TNT 1-94 [Tanacetum coccineum]
MVWSGYIVLMSGKTDSIKLNNNPGCLPGSTFVYNEVSKLDFSSASLHVVSSSNSITSSASILLNGILQLVLASKLPLSFWAEAVATACYTQNRSIIISAHGKTAYHIINDRKPSIKHLHIFGCTCYITRDGENLDKMKKKKEIGDPCVMVGYSTQSKGYRVYNKRTRFAK